MSWRLAAMMARQHLRSCSRCRLVLRFRLRVTFMTSIKSETQSKCSMPTLLSHSTRHHLCSGSTKLLLFSIQILRLDVDILSGIEGLLLFRISTLMKPLPQLPSCLLQRCALFGGSGLSRSSCASFEELWMDSEDVEGSVFVSCIH